MKESRRKKEEPSSPAATKNYERKLEEALRISNERFDLLAKATNDAIWDWDFVTGKVIRMGTGFEKLFGYDLETTTREDDFWSKRVHPDDRARVSGGRRHLLQATQNIYWEDRYRFLKADGQYAYVYDKAYIIRDEKGNAVRLIGAMQDFTKDKEQLDEIVRIQGNLERTAEQLRELNIALDQRAKELAASNTELEQFAYIASHDLQEPLRAVTSFLQLLEQKYAGLIDETGNKYIRFAVDGAERMKMLILDLLEYSRAGAVKEDTGLTDMNEVVQEVLKNLNKTIQETQARLDVEQLPVLAHARKPQMLQLMQNLISNALKYCDAKNPEIKIGAKEEDKEWVFFVQDNGIGIEQQHRERIFVIFQRLHNRNEYSGTGIGLSICKKIVEGHGGTIRVESTPGKGSTFYFSLSKQGLTP
jgi:PAS domain S-box-containing protein